MAKPVYVFSGFIDSGKTRCIKETLFDSNFNLGEPTLIICFEEGDEEYDERFLKITNSKVVYLDSINELTLTKQKELDKTFNYERVFIEFNGMEDDNILYQNGFIKNWELAQTITTVDASKFNVYLNNMRQIMYNHIVNAEVAILNRSDNLDKRYLRNNLKSINTRLEIIYEDKDGNVTNKLEDDLFDLSKDLFIDDLDYGLWYMDAVDNAQKYDNKRITIKVKYLAKLKQYDNVLIMGRRAMVCCNNDIQNIGLTCVGIKKEDIDVDSFYYLSGIIHTIDDEDGYKTCLLYVDKIETAANPKEELITFN